MFNIPTFDTGEPVTFGDMVMSDDDKEFVVDSIEFLQSGKCCMYDVTGNIMATIEPGKYAIRPTAMLDINGEKLVHGDITYSVFPNYSVLAWTVDGLYPSKNEVHIHCGSAGCTVKPNSLSHKKPINDFVKDRDDWPIEFGIPYISSNDGILWYLSSPFVGDNGVITCSSYNPCVIKDFDPKQLTRGCGLYFKNGNEDYYHVQDKLYED
jgi:hypothetical protein